MRKKISISLFLLLILEQLYIGSNPLIFIDVVSLIIFLSVILFAVLTKHGVKSFKQFFISIEERDRISRSVMTSSIFAGIIGYIVGMILMLSNLSDPSAIGPAMAISLLTVFYGLFFYLIFYISSNAKAIKADYIILITVVIGTLLSFFVLLLSFAKTGDSTDHFKDTELIKAVKHNDIYLVKQVKCIPCEVNVVGDFNKTPLMYALKQGNLKIAKLLLDNGADPYIIDHYYNSSFKIPIKNNNIQTLKLMIKYLKNDTELTYLLSESIKTPLIFKGWVEKNDHQGYRKIMEKELRANLEIVKLLIKKGADPKISKEINSLMLAASAGKFEIAKYLLEIGVDINKQSMKATYYESTDSYQYEADKTALMFAIFGMRPRAGEIVFPEAMMGIDENKLRIKNYANRERIMIIKYLLEKKAKTDIVNTDVKTALVIAKEDQKLALDLIENWKNEEWEPKYLIDRLLIADIVVELLEKNNI